MKSACIPFSEIPQTSKLFDTYLTDFPRLAAWFPQPPTEVGIAAAARNVRFAPESRGLLVEILRDQNRGFAPGGELDAAAEKNLARLAAGAAAIVTGQQVGLFSGSALTLYKALTAIRVAEEMSRSGVEAVPVFWLATEDHDLAEINHTFWKTRNGLARYELPADPEHQGKSVGTLKLGAGIPAIVEEAAQTLDGPGAADLARALRESYVPGESYGSAFAKLLARILAGRGILIIDPQDPRFDKLAAPLYRRALESAAELREALLARSRALEEAGYHAQVKVTRESTLLFYTVEGRREALRSREDGGFAAGSAIISQSDLLGALDRHPELFTASALLRPLLQDTILPTAACIGGPAEIAYLAQSQAIYEKILGGMPAILPRASFTLIEAPIGRFLDQYGLELRDVLRGKQHVRVQMERKTMPGELTQRFEADEEAMRKMIRGYREPLERLDYTLLGSVEAVEEKILGMFLKLKEKVGRAENFRTGVLDRHEGILTDSLYPNHELQERNLSLLPHLAAHGPNLLDQILSAAGLAGSASASSCANQHQILFLD